MYSQGSELHLTATGIWDMPHGITLCLCYLPPDTSEHTLL